MSRVGAKRKLRDREKNGRAQRVPQADHGTPERWAKPDRPELEETMTAGKLRARVKQQCLLDALLDAGELGEPPASSRRYDAGLWLRRLYLRTREPCVVALYEQLTASHEMSDEQAAAHALYRRTVLAMGRDFGVLRKVCCEDHMGPFGLLPALDRLADWRGM